MFRLFIDLISVFFFAYFVQNPTTSPIDKYSTILYNNSSHAAQAFSLGNVCINSLCAFHSVFSTCSPHIEIEIQYTHINLNKFHEASK